MTIVTIRRAMADDYDRLEAAAERFAKRHKITRLDYHGSWEDTVEQHIDYLDFCGCWEDAAYLRRLWRAVIRRALREPNAHGIAYGHVVYYTD